MSSRNDDMLKIDELFDEVLEIYDFDINAIVLHLSSVYAKYKMGSSSLKKQNISAFEIKADLSEQKRLERYRYGFEQILDSMNSEVKRFKKISKYDITEYSEVIRIMFENIEEDKEILNVVDSKKITKNLVDIVFYSDKLINLINK